VEFIACDSRGPMKGLIVKAIKGEASPFYSLMCWSSLTMKNTQKEAKYDLTYTPTGGFRYDIDGMSHCTH